MSVMTSYRSDVSRTRSALSLLVRSAGLLIVLLLAAAVEVATVNYFGLGATIVTSTMQ